MFTIHESEYIFYELIRSHFIVPLTDQYYVTVLLLFKVLRVQFNIFRLLLLYQNLLWIFSNYHLIFIIINAISKICH